MNSVRVYEPALCCNTGVCGPELDQALVTFTADLNAVRTAEADIARFNLAGDPFAFAENPVVVNFLQTAGPDGLPLTLVNGATVMTGRYPSRDELLRFAGLEAARSTLPMADSCCGGAEETASSGCCGGSSAATQEAPAAASQRGCCSPVGSAS